MGIFQIFIEGGDSKIIYREIPTTLKEEVLEEKLIATEVKWYRVDSVLPAEGCEVPDGKMNDEEWDKNGSRNVADRYGAHKMGGDIKSAIRGEKVLKVQYDPPYN